MSALPKDNQGLKVLVVEDNDDGREMYAEYLRFRGYEVAVASNGVDALDKARGEPFDAVLMDLSMPALDGWSATRALREDARTRELPVLALSGHATGSKRQEALEAGADDFLSKPCAPDEVEERIRPLLRRRGPFRKR